MKLSFLILSFVLFTSLSSNFVIAQSKCDITNPVYSSILAADVYESPSTIKFSERQFILLDNEEIFYFDRVKLNTCYIKLVTTLHDGEPKLNLYSYYSNFETYKKSFETDSNESPEISEMYADGFIISIRGTQGSVDVYNDLQMLFFTIPDYF